MTERLKQLLSLFFPMSVRKDKRRRNALSAVPRFFMTRVQSKKKKNFGYWRHESRRRNNVYSLGWAGQTYSSLKTAIKSSFVDRETFCPTLVHNFRCNFFCVFQLSSKRNYFVNKCWRKFVWNFGRLKWCLPNVLL